MTGQTTQEIIKETEDIESMLQKSEQRATTGSNWKPVNDRITKDILFHEPVSLPQNNDPALGAEVHFKKYCTKRKIKLQMIVQHFTFLLLRVLVLKAMHHLLFLYRNPSQMELVQKSLVT